MAELDNCLQCGKLFVRALRPICQDCYNIEEEKFQLVYNFMKKRVNREATIPEIVEGTGVEETLIIKFVKEKRLRTSQFPNLTYPCERCGAEIVDGTICDQCSNEIANELTFQEELKAINARNEEEERKKIRTYYTIDRAKRNR